MQLTKYVVNKATSTVMKSLNVIPNQVQINYTHVENGVHGLCDRIRTPYHIHYLKARSIWITKQGMKLQIPIEDSYPVFETIFVASVLTTIDIIQSQPRHLITDVHVVLF